MFQYNENNERIVEWIVSGKDVCVCLRVSLEYAKKHLVCVFY